MKNILCVSILIAFISGCKVLSSDDIRKTPKIELDALELYPSVEPNFLRIDVLRQQETTTTGEVTTTSDVPYHPFGFDLGNGLFIDLNMNICFRMDSLIGIPPFQNYMLECFSNKKNLLIEKYRYENDTMYEVKPKTGKIIQKYHVENYGDSIAYFDGKRFDYAISRTEKQINFYPNRRYREIIYKESDNEYALRISNKRQRVYLLEENNLHLGNGYTLKMSNDRKKMVLWDTHRRRQSLLYIFEKAHDRIFVYDLNFSGKVIYFSQNTLQIQHNEYFGGTYRLTKLP